jgi:hypothetical protein
VQGDTEGAVKLLDVAVKAFALARPPTSANVAAAADGT